MPRFYCLLIWLLIVLVIYAAEILSRRYQPGVRERCSERSTAYWHFSRTWLIRRIVDGWERHHSSRLVGTLTRSASHCLSSNYFKIHRTSQTIDINFQFTQKHFSRPFSRILLRFLISTTLKFVLFFDNNSHDCAITRRTKTGSVNNSLSIVGPRP